MHHHSVGCCFVVYLLVLGIRGDGPCAPGEYRAVEQEEVSCYSCMAGTFSDGFDRASCDACGIGTFANASGATQCAQCPAGTFQYAQGSSGCMACQAGTFQGDSGSSACSRCLPGAAQGEEGRTSCQACAPGRFSWEEKASACSACHAGSHQPFDGGTACLACDVGTAQAFPGSATCTSCTPGRFQPQKGQTACLLCVAGKFQPLFGSSECEACPIGSFLAHPGQSRAEACSSCPSGTFSPRAGSTNCSACPAGTFRNASGNACTPCEPGTFQPVEGSSACASCQPGTYAAQPGTTLACLPCKAGTFSTTSGAGDDRACQSCDAGLYSTGVGQADPEVCGPCALGFFPRDDHGGCLPCPEGQFFCPPFAPSPVPCQDEGLLCNGTHMDAGPGLLPYLHQDDPALWLGKAVPCPQGSLCALKDPILGKGLLPPWPQQVHFAVLPTGASRRVEWPFDADTDAVYWLEPEGCRAGWFLQEDECLPCPNGTFSPHTGALDNSVCEACEAGTFSSTIDGSTACDPCAPGTFQLRKGMSECDACLPGEFQDVRGAQGCKVCPRGSFSPDPHAMACISCPTGKAQPDMGGTSCVACNASSEYSGEGDGRCWPCGRTPSSLDPAHDEGCSLSVDLPDHAAWVNVRGLDYDDECLALANSTLEDVGVLRLHGHARCEHRLRVAARSTGEVWRQPDNTGPPRSVRSLQVIPYDSTFRPSSCDAGEGFGVLFTLRDEQGLLIAAGDEPVESGKAWMSVLDPGGTHLLFQGACGVRVCHTARFCPTMDVLVRVSLKLDKHQVVAEGQAALSAQQAVPCPPVGSWLVGIHMQAPGRAYFPGSQIRIDLRVHSSPTHVQAFQLALSVSKSFRFVSFEPAVPTQHREEHGLLTLQGDTSQLAGTPLDELGTLILACAEQEVDTTGVVPALHVDRSQFMLLKGSWLSVPVQSHGFGCRHDGVLAVLLDRPRVTALIASPTRRRLVNWRALAGGARVWPGSISVQAVWNTRGPATPAEDPECSSLAQDVLRVGSCFRIEPVARESKEGCVLVQFQQARTAVCFDVLVPEQARILAYPSSTGRLLVGARLLGVEVDATHALALQDETTCAPDAVLLGQPVMQPCALPATLATPFLFSGRWTTAGSFRLNPPVLSSQSGAVLVLTGELETPLISADPSRAILDPHDSYRLHLVRAGGTPRCVKLLGAKAWMVPVIPPAPGQLKVELSATTLVAQQDPWRLIPTVSRVSKAAILFSDGVLVDVTGDARLILGVGSTDYLKPVPPDGIQTRSLGGLTHVVFSFAGIPCLSARAAVAIFESSVTGSVLECVACPPQLATLDDPLGLEWPELFPISIPVASVRVRYTLVDGTVHIAPDDSLLLDGGVFLDTPPTRFGSMRPASLLSVSTHRAVDQRLSFSVLDRWAVAWTLLCNGLPCEQATNLAPQQDGASLPPFNYATQVTLSFELELANGTTLELPRLPMVDVFVNGTLLKTQVLAFTQPGVHALHVVFADQWRLERSQLSTSLQVHALSALRIDAPAVLHQVHCTRMWETGRIQVFARLSDGSEGLVNASLTLGGVIELHQDIIVVRWPGLGIISASHGGLSALHSLAVVPESRVVSSFRLSTNLPEVWTAPQGTTLPLQVELFPSMAVQDPILARHRILRWVASEQGIVDFPDESSIRLLSDFYDDLTVSGIIRTCQGEDPVIISHRMRVNLAPDRPGQVDFGQEDGIAVPSAGVGERLEIPLFLFAPPGTPLTGYSGRVSLPGVLLDPVCPHGELPFSACTVAPDLARLQIDASFPPSQRVGRIHAGTLRGIVQLNGVSRLKVELDGTSFEFAIKLGKGSAGAIQLRANTVQPVDTQEEPFHAWNAPPDQFRACCHQLIAAPKSGMEALFPGTFLLNLTVSRHPLRITDPRVQIYYDDQMVRVDPSTGRWSAVQGARGVTTLKVRYVQPATLKARTLALKVTFAEARALRIAPESLELSRLHCSDTVFETKRLHASLVLAHSRRVVQLSPQSLGVLLASEIESIASVHENPSGFRVRGRLPGITLVTLKAFGLRATARVTVLNASIPLRALRLPDPYTLLSAVSAQKIRLGGVLASGQVVRDVTFFVSPSLAVKQEDLGVVALEPPFHLRALANSHPAGRHELLVTVRACGDQPALTISSPLVVRVSPVLTDLRPADIVIHPSSSSSSFEAVLVAQNPVTSLVLRLFTDAPALTGWTPGTNFPVWAELVLNSPSPGSLVLAGIFPSPIAGGRLLTIEPMPLTISGYIETYSESTGSSFSPIRAGRFGGGEDQPTMNPVVNSAELARAHLARQDPSFLLRLIVGKARLVEPVLYSNDREISAMFHVVDRFLQPDTALPALDVIFHTASPQLQDLLLALDGAGRLIPDTGVSVPAQHVMDGWYAVQTLSPEDPLPPLTVPVSFRLSLANNVTQEGVVPEPLVTGRELHACPRYATDRAIFALFYQMKGRPAHGLQQSLACLARVALRRVDVWQVNGTITMFSIKVESFIRMHQAHQAIMNSSKNITARPGPRRLLAPEAPVVERVGIRVVNDSADSAVGCPPGMYYSVNGTYQRLPLHGLTGTDCYGFTCMNGYVLEPGGCSPAAVPLDIIWISVLIISGILGVMSCVLFALYMSRIHSTAEAVSFTPEPIPSTSQPSNSDVFTEEDEDSSSTFRSIFSGVYLDEFSASMLDDELFSTIALDPPTPRSFPRPS